VFLKIKMSDYMFQTSYVPGKNYFVFVKYVQRNCSSNYCC